jgi:hypothetical protein
LQSLELTLTPDEGMAKAADAPRPHQRQRADESAAGDPSGLSLRLHRHRLVELEGAADRRRRALADQDLSRLGGLLQPRCHVHRVARHEGAAFTRPPHDDVPGVHADPQRKALAEELLESPLHREGRMKRTLRVIFLRGGRAECCHDCIPDELLDRPAGAFDLGRHGVVETVEESARALWVLCPCELCRADEVGEEDCRQLPLLARVGRTRERVGAARTESSACRDGLATARAERHCRKCDALSGIFRASALRQIAEVSSDKALLNAPCQRGRRGVYAPAVRGLPPPAHHPRLLDSASPDSE